MAAPAESGSRGRPDRKVALFRSTSEEQQARWGMIEIREVLPILRSDIYYHPKDGSIYYVIWRDVKPEHEIPDRIELLRPLPKQADIFAPRTRFLEWKSGVVHHTEDIKRAIRVFNHIINNTRNRETGQTNTLRTRASRLLDFFADKPFSNVSETEFAEVRGETYAVLAEAGLNPKNLVNQEKAKIVKWILRPEKDSLDRWNKLIRLGALQAAVRHAVEHRRNLATEVESKFLRGREALTLEDNFSTTIFQETIDHLAPVAMPATIAFTRSFDDVSKYQKGVVRGLLGTMEHQLARFIRVNPYRQPAREAAVLLGEAKDLYEVGERDKLTAEIFPRIRTILLAALAEKSDLSPPSVLYFSQ